MAYTTITAGTIGIADGDQSPQPLDGTVRITPRFPSAATDSGFIASGPVIVTVADGDMPKTEIPAREDATALVEFHLYDREAGPVRMPSTEIPIEPDATIDLREYLPVGVDPLSGYGISKGERGSGITAVTATGGVVTVEWEGGEDVEIPIPTAALATATNDGLMPATTMAAVSPIQEGDAAAWRVLDEDGREALSVTAKGNVRTGGSELSATDGAFRITDADGSIALEVVGGTTRIYDMDSGGDGIKPTRTAQSEKWTPSVTERTTYYPCFMDHRDRTTMINYNSTTLRFSRDEGSTWFAAHTFLDPVRSGIIMDNGECLIATRRDNDHYTLWLSRGWSLDPITAEWTLVLTNNVPRAYPTNAFSWSQYRNMIFVADYGPKLGQSGMTDAARHVRMSRDYGKTWEIVFDLLTDHPEMDIGDGTGLHLHGVEYDPYWDRIWVTFGDDQQGTVFSDDLGKTWHSIHFSDYPSGPWQSVGIIALPKCILFASDGHPNGVTRIDRRQGKGNPSPEKEVAYRRDAAQSLTSLCQNIWRAERPGDDAPVLFEFCSAPGDGNRFIVSTVDGFTFNKIWEGGGPNGNSSGRAYGPTASGRLLHYAYDATLEPNSWTLREGPMPSGY